MQTKLRKVLSLTLLIVLVAFFIRYIYNHLSDFKQLELANPWFILALLVMALISSINNGLVLKFLLAPFQIVLTFKEWFGLSVSTSFYNLITPFKGGAVSRALYLKNKHNFSYANFLSTLSGSYVIIILTMVIVGLFTTISIYLTENKISLLILGILIAFLIPLLIVVIFSPKVKETKHAFVNKFIHVINGWHSIKSNKKVVLFVFILTLTNLIMGTIGVVITYKVLGIQVTFMHALFMTSVGSLSILISITPGGIGIVEAISIFLASLVGITPAQSLTASILSRIVGVTVIFILGPIYSYILLKDLKKKQENNK